MSNAAILPDPVSARSGFRRTRPRRDISPYEFWSPWILYGPVIAQWVLLGLWNRDFALPSLANPNIASGGLCGESKTAILDQVSGEARAWIAPYEAFVTGDEDVAAAQEIMSRLDLSFPIVLKPDIGCKGAGVKLIPDGATLTRVLASYPRGVTVIVQYFVRSTNEAGLFYSRQPGHARGRILSLTFKTQPRIIGDGHSSIRDLILAHPRAGRVPQIYMPRLADRLDEILPAGRDLALVFTGNHSKGSMFRDVTDLVTPALTQRLDAILRSLPEFHHGRVDVRFDSVADLLEGKGFQIIEINGVGSEPIHMWDPKATLRDIYAAQFRFYGLAFRIGRLMRARGHRSRGIREIWRLWREQTRLISLYPSSD